MGAKVSVILPSLNVADYIRECMDSVISQSLQEIEIICVDAGSVDGTRKILSDYAQKDARVTVLDSSIKSYGRQVNIGLDHASGEYIAVLETDDWVERGMYQCLYEHASKDQLDYAAADFDMFFRLQSGEYYYLRHHLFGGERQGWYAKVLGPCQIAVLRADDYVLWRGIYNRDFIDRHRIRLHESPGAAFQDMGFLQQTKTYAKKAKYIDKSFYRYRQGRGEASSGKPEGLQYYQGEFLWLNSKFGQAGLEKLHEKYYYYTMSIAFLTKYEQVLSVLKGRWQDKRLEGPWVWFKEQVFNAIKRGLLDEAIYGREVWERLQLLLSSQESHARFMSDREREKKKPKQELLEKIGDRPVIIFGCGTRGEKLMLFCERNQVKINAFCDNRQELCGGKKYGFPVILPSELESGETGRNSVIVLSMRHGAEQAYSQLTGMGIEPGRVIGGIPEGIL